MTTQVMIPKVELKRESALADVDQALEKSRSPEKAEPDSALTPPEALGSAGKLSKLLRISAMVVLLAAAGTFLFQGWQGWDSISRSTAFLAFVSSLAAMGGVCGLGLKDPKAARISLGVAIAIIPAAFCQLGALIYAHFWGTALNVPELLRFTHTGMPGLMLVGGLTLLVTAPVIYSGFRVLARPAASNLSLLFLGLNAALLIPYRNPDVLGFLALALSGVAVSLDLIWHQPRAELRTPEAKVARTMLVIPIVLLVGRNIFLHFSSTLLFANLFAIAAAFMFVAVPLLTDNKRLIINSERLGTIPLGISWMLYASGLFFTYKAPLPISRDLIIVTMALPFSALLLAISTVVHGNGANYRRVAAWIAVLGCLWQLTAQPTLIASFMCISVAIVVMAFGSLLGERGLFKTGMLGLALGVLYHLRYASFVYHGLGPWISLGILGLLTLLASSYVERHYGRLLAYAREFGKLFKSET